MGDSRRDLNDAHLNNLVPDMLAWFKKHGVA